jgi:hypothetical protein
LLQLQRGCSIHSSKATGGTVAAAGEAAAAVVVVVAARTAQEGLVLQQQQQQQAEMLLAVSAGKTAALSMRLYCLPHCHMLQQYTSS